MDFTRSLQFLAKLKKNNNKEWFDKHRDEYDSIRKEVTAFTGEMIRNLQSFDATLAGLEPRHCMFRINRDIRFSSDKTPYKTNFGLVFTRGGKSSPYAGYYLHIGPGEIFLGGGIWAPMPEQLASIRQEIDYNFNDFKKIVSHKDFKKYFKELEGEKLARPPKGYDANNPAVEFLKHKHFLMGHHVTEKQLNDKGFMKYSKSVYSAMKPMLYFLNGAVGEG